MGKARFYNQSDDAIEAQRKYAKRKAAALRFIFSTLKEEERPTFDRLINRFNDQFEADGGKITKHGDV